MPRARSTSGLRLLLSHASSPAEIAEMRPFNIGLSPSRTNSLAFEKKAILATAPAPLTSKSKASPSSDTTFCGGSGHTFVARNRAHDTSRPDHMRACSPTAPGISLRTSCNTTLRVASLQACARESASTRSVAAADERPSSSETKCSLLRCCLRRARCLLAAPCPLWHCVRNETAAASSLPVSSERRSTGIVHRRPSSCPVVDPNGPLSTSAPAPRIRSDPSRAGPIHAQLNEPATDCCSPIFGLPQPALMHPFACSMRIVRSTNRGSVCT